MRVTCDANVLVRAAISPKGPARAVLENMLEPPHALVLSAWILDEVRRVLSYDRVQKQAKLTPEQIDTFVTSLSESADLVILQESVPALTHDPDDDFVLATAVQGKANVVCSRDHHLHHADVQSYCALQSLRVLTDTQLLTELRSEKDAGSGPQPMTN